jgi:hypothetical protein
MSIIQPRGLAASHSYELLTLVRNDHLFSERDGMRRFTINTSPTLTALCARWWMAASALKSTRSGRALTPARRLRGRYAVGSAWQACPRR